MNELLNRFMTMLRPESAQQVATSPLTVPQAGMLNRLFGLATTQAQGAMQAAPEQLARSRQMLADWQPGQEVSPELMDQFINLTSFAPAGMFVGAKSKLFDKKAAELYKSLEKQGVDKVSAWQQTGTFRAPDGKLRQEISDQAAAFQPTKWQKPYKETPEYETAKLGEAFSHPELYKSYPELANLDIGLNPNIAGKWTQASWHEANPELGLPAYMQMNVSRPTQIGRFTDWLARLNNPENPAYWKSQVRENIQDGLSPRESIKEMRNYMAQQQQKLADVKSGKLIENTGIPLHEIQHGIQEIEGFARGGNPSMMAKVLDDEKFRKLELEHDKLLGRFNELKDKYAGITDIPKSVVDEINIIKPRISQLQGQARDMLNRKNVGGIDYSEKELNDAYRRLYGEVEARLTDLRKNLSPEERLRYFPLEQQSGMNPYGVDVPLEEMIIRMQGPKIVNQP